MIPRKRQLYWKALSSIDRVRAWNIQRKGLIESESIILSGSPRSGTSWLMNVIGRLPKFSSIGEPLHPRWFIGATEAGFIGRCYIPPFSLQPTKQEFLRTILSGRRASLEPAWKPPVLSEPVRTLFEAWQRIRSDRLVIKFTRASRMLSWLAETFPQFNCVHLVRHPCAVINSQLSNEISGYVDAAHTLYDYLKSNDLHTELHDIVLKEAREFFGRDLSSELEKRITSIAGVLAASWIMDNTIPLNAKHDSRWFIVNYEDLISEPVNVVAAIADWCTLDIHRSEIKMALAGRLSSKDPEKQKCKWKLYLDEIQIGEIWDVLEICGFRDISCNYS